MARMTLSASKIASLVCRDGKKQTDYFHKELAGFGVRVSAGGAKTYFVQCRVKGRVNDSGRQLEIRHTLGKFTEKIDPAGRRRPDPKQFDEMCMAAHKVISDAEKGITPADRERERDEERKEKERQRLLEEAKDVTLRDLLKQYISAKCSKGKLKESTATQYSQSLETHCGDWLDVPARSITKAMVEERHLEISKRHKVNVGSGEKIRGGNIRIRGGKGTADATMRALRAVINYGVAMDDVGAFTTNPVNVLKASGWFNLGRRESSIATDHLKAWFAGVEAIDNPAIKVMVQVSLFTGARKNEVASLTWSDVNLNATTPYAVFRETKNGKQLLIPLAAHVVKLLQDYKGVTFSGPDGFLFPSWGKSGYLKDPRRQIKKAIDAGGVQFMPHDSRRTFLSFCNHEELSIPKWTQKRLCNHALPQDVTEGYVQHELKSLQATVERIAAFILKHAGIDGTHPGVTDGVTSSEKVVNLDQTRRKRRAA